MWMKADILTKVRCIFFASVVIACCAGCTRNNGDIGDWFGTWQMTAIMADGEPVAGYERNIFWKFQNEILNLVRVDTGEGENSRDDRWGTWKQEGDRLMVDFTYSDDKNPVESGEAGTSIYAPFPIMHIPYGKVSDLVIESRSGSSLTLTYVASDAVAYTYTLKKQ